MINQATSGDIRTRTTAGALLQNLGSLCQGVLEHAPDWTGDARFHLGQARRALDHGDFGRAQREAARALELDSVSPWPLVVSARCAQAQKLPDVAAQLLVRAQRRAPNNRYVAALLSQVKAEAHA